MPIQKVSIREFTQEDVDTLVKVLMRDQPVFTVDPSQEIEMTKKQLESILIQTQKELALHEEEKVGMTTEELQEKIESLKENI